MHLATDFLSLLLFCFSFFWRDAQKSVRDEPYTDGKQQKIKQKGYTERMQSIWCPYFHQSRNEKENNSGGFLFPLPSVYLIHREDSHTATSRTTCVVKLKQAAAVLFFSLPFGKVSVTFCTRFFSYLSMSRRMWRDRRLSSIPRRRRSMKQPTAPITATIKQTNNRPSIFFPLFFLNRMNSYIERNLHFLHAT